MGNFINVSLLAIETYFNINVDFVPVVTYTLDCYLKTFSVIIFGLHEEREEKTRDLMNNYIRNVEETETLNMCFQYADC